MNDKNNYLAHFESFLLTEKRVSNNTFLAYKKDIDQLVDFLKKEKTNLKNCTNIHLKNYYVYLKIKA